MYYYYLVVTVPTESGRNKRLLLLKSYTLCIANYSQVRGNNDSAWDLNIMLKPSIFHLLCVCHLDDVIRYITGSLRKHGRQACGLHSFVQMWYIFHLICHRIGNVLKTGVLVQKGHYFLMIMLVQMISFGIYCLVYNIFAESNSHFHPGSSYTLQPHFPPPQKKTLSKLPLVHNQLDGHWGDA